MPDAINPLRFKPSFARQAGAQLLATVVTTMLFGVALGTIIRYFSTHSRNDSLWIKILIAALAVLATLETVFANHQIYLYFVVNNNNQDARNYIPFSMPAKTACIFLAAFLSQLRNGPSKSLALQRNPNRISRHLTTGRRIDPGRCNSKTNTVMWGRVAQNVLSMYLNGAGTAACDILISITLVIILRSTDLVATRRTKTLLEKLVVYAVNRGILTSAFALLSIFLYNFASGTLYYLIPFSANTHIYIISVISMLAAREGLRADLDRSFHVSDLIMKTMSNKTQDVATSQSSAVVEDTVRSLQYHIFTPA
ncbi:hypothetical protein D9611_008170 [Ephemerocybe angulata]|uniref:DUF6534 domain-containing protein n=1 Tax=Ephemerocybe angulata TaxID=980116 RepID=A0A8H5BZI5_9AGAR|nr:hypothetical protein D9611_008170 [Tulosesus angulatus]